MEDFRKEEAEEIMSDSSLLKMLESILLFASPDENVYYLKLEALWTLTNLSYFDEVNTMRIINSSVEPADICDADINTLQ